VAEGAGLENRYTGNGIVGSNPTLSARLKKAPLRAFFSLVHSRGVDEPTGFGTRGLPLNENAAAGQRDDRLQ
jgi:hypothetical protein